MQRIACQLGLALGDGKLAFILGLQLLRRKAQVIRRVSGLAACTEGIADFNGTRTVIAGEQNAADCCVQFVIGRRIGTGECCTAAGARTFRIAIARSLA
eukprot:3142960-Pleurochrysis_carterae.AAC.1